ncbi:MAG: response regulator transcription factor [Treponema sp.]|nr:response regulator transcription factor [Treponema sp.]
MINITIESEYKEERRAITSELERQKDFCVTGAGESGFHALRSAMTQKPDVIIMDYSMSDVDSLKLAPVIKRNSPETSLIVLCSRDECGPVRKALNAGISGCFLKREGYKNLAASVRSVYYGGLYLSEKVKACAWQSAGDSPLRAVKGGAEKPCLTRTELNIVEGGILGRTDREIAKNLNMHTGSLRNCISRIKKKTGMRSRIQITAFALLTGYLNAGEIWKEIAGPGQDSEEEPPAGTVSATHKKTRLIGPRQAGDNGIK